MEENEIRYFSMFTGAGGFELGLQGNRCPQSKGGGSKQDLLSREQDPSGKEYNSFTCVGQSEINKYASKLLEQRFPNIRNWGDCTLIRPEELPEFDMLCGGFPCQAFSIAGKRGGLEDTRGTLFFEVARISKVKRPKIIFLENVKGLLNHEGGKTFRIFLQTLDELGYEVQWMVFNSKFFGVPQSRERVFIIGNLRGESRSEILPFRCNDKDINESRPVVRTFTAGGHSGGLHSNSTAIVRAVLTPDRAEKRQNGRRFKEPGEPSFTMTGQDIHGVAIMRGRPKMPYEHGKRELNYTTYKDACPTLSQNCASGDQKNIVMPMIRRLTPLECERLQGFPDNWTEGFSDTQRYKMMGNAVTVNVIKAIGEKISASTSSNEETKK